jgi:3-hydroxyisobutyrate dehydrogenase
MGDGFALAVAGNELSRMRPAFLGLGAIGKPMATRVAAAFPSLTVWNRTADKAAAFAAEAKVAAASTPADCVRDADVVITCFPTSSDVASLLDGPTGLLAGMRNGTVLVDCTSGDPATSRRIAERLAEKGIGYLDAPVSGGVAGAEKGTLTVMVGGDSAVLERVMPVLKSFGQKIVHCGEVGAGDALKAGNNALLAIHVWTTAEILVTLKKAGVDPKIALDVINLSSGRSNASMNLFPERVMTRKFPRTFRLALLDKDIGIAAQVARENKVPVPVTQLVADLFTMARGELGEVADHVEAAKILEQWAGAEIS